MFEDFDKKASTEGRGRRGVSAVLSIGMFGEIALAIGGAVTAHQVHRARVEREQQVTFADLPQVQAPKPKTVKAKAAKRSVVKRQPVLDLKEIPKGRPDEAEGELAMTEGTGEVDGVLERKASAPAPAAPPPPPPPKPEPVAPLAEQERESIDAPKFIAGCRSLDLPPALMATAATIRIEVEMMIDENGKVVSAKVVQSHPMIPDAMVIACASAQHFQPAHLPDGTAIPYPYRTRFVLKPSQA